MAPAQLAVANANAKAAQTNADNAPALAAANLARVRAEVKSAQNAVGGNWGGLDTNAQKQGALGGAINKGILGPKGGLVTNPMTAWANAQSTLKEFGLGSNAAAQRIAKQEFLKGLHTSHANHEAGGYAWNGKRVVPTGNSYKVINGKTVLVNKAGKVIPDYVPKG
jgi:hypothetical protein